MTQTTMSNRDRLIPWYIVGFFAFIAVMDGIFVYLATSTHTGVVTEQAYQRGLDYNETVAAAETQAALGWSGDIQYQDDGEFVFSLSTETREAVTGAEIIAEFTRPTHNGVDFSVPIVERSPGTYQAPVAFPLDGLWDVRVFVTWNQQQYQQAARLIIR